jgi:hypothetical protein
VTLNPRQPRQKYAQYLEAWHLLGGEEDSGGKRDDGACDAGKLPGFRTRRNCRKQAVCLGKTKRGAAPGFSALGCERLRGCIECYLVRLMAGR